MEMYRTAKEFSDRGHHVILDGVLSERPEIPDHYHRMREILADSPLYMVHVTCPLEICRQRNLARGDRGEFQSHEQAEHMPQNVDYALEVDTSVLSSEECAEIIIKTIFGK
jgi:adenylylsulfate kinase/chloramphenicol 3-O phosphotransferase